MKTKMDKLIEKINYYANLEKKRALTSEETQKRIALRKEYLGIFRENFKKQLESIKIVDKKRN